MTKAQSTTGRERKRSASTTSKPPRRTRGGHEPTGTSANRRARTANGASPKGKRAKEELTRAARVVFERDGYIDARVSDIVKEANMAHGSFYTYFPSKLEVFQAVLQDMGKAVRAAVAHDPDDVPGDTVRNLERANRRYLEAYRDHAKLMALMEQVATVDPVIAAFRLDARERHVTRIAGTIRRLQDQGLADASLDPTTTAAALVAMLSSYAYWSTVKPMDSDLGTTAKTVTLIWSRTLGLQSANAS